MIKEVYYKVLKLACYLDALVRCSANHFAANCNNRSTTYQDFIILAHNQFRPFCNCKAPTFVQVASKRPRL